MCSGLRNTSPAIAQLIPLITRLHSPRPHNLNARIMDGRMQYCNALAPCSKVFITYPELAETSAPPLIHTSLTTLTRYEGCSYDNRACDSFNFDLNVVAAQEWMAANYPVNLSFPCFYDPE